MTETRDLSERYASAMHSAHLEVEPERCDVDYLIAAGLATESLGTALFRLASEWDLAGAEYRMMRRHIHRIELDVMQVRRNCTRHPERYPDVERVLHDCELTLASARGQALTAKTMAMTHLKTLGSATARLREYAQGLADRDNFHASPRMVDQLAVDAMERWLDAICSACSGRGFNGGFQSPRLMCTQCGATGRSHHMLAKTERHTAFLRRLLAEMDWKCHRVQQQMSRMLRQRT